jgi:hypothetical protein
VISARVPLATIALLAATACSSASESANIANAAAASKAGVLDPATVTAERWTNLYAESAALIAAANDLGFSNGPMTATGATPAFSSTGPALDIPFERVRKPSTATLVIEGAAADRVDRIGLTYELRARDKVEFERAKTGFRNLVFGIMQRRETYPDTRVNAALRAVKPFKSGLPIGSFEIASQDRGGHNRRLTATITRTAEALPAVPSADARK